MDVTRNADIPSGENHESSYHTTAPVVFSFEAFSVRVTMRDGEPWFVAADVAEVLDYRNAPDMTRNLDDDEKGTQIVRTPGGQQELTTISESGLYSAILKSRKPEAKKFKKWVTAEVLPSIRKTGQYSSPSPKGASRPRYAKSNDGLDKLRTANAIKLAEETAARLCARFPSLGESARQVIFAKIINPIAGDEILALPQVVETLKKAGDVGAMLGVSANMIGRLANRHGLKTSEYGENRLDKSPYSDKQVEAFHYNAKAVERLRELIAGGNEHDIGSPVLVVVQ